MKKKLFRILIIILLFGLSGCSNTVETAHDNIVLPDLSGMNKREITEVFNNLNHDVVFEYTTEQDELLAETFIEYKDYQSGDIINETNEVVVILYPIFTGETTYLTLPDLSGLSREEISALFADLDVAITFVTSGEVTEETSNMFISYGQFLVPGDSFIKTSVLPIIIYPDFYGEINYFSPIEMIYDGPLLSSDFESIDPLEVRGGYFSVTLKSCIDGDTAAFNYPIDVYNAIENPAKTTRFLNMDTEETYSGGEEEWGKPASVYTCELLTSAEEIILQTDPGDNLLGTYGRLLAWIWIKLPNEDNYELLNYIVVKQGLAQVKYEFGAGETISYGEHTYNEWMHLAENYAKSNSLGEWGDALDYYWNYEENKPYWSRWY